MKYFDEKKTFPKIKKDALMDMPIPALDVSGKAGKANHDNLAMIARQIEGVDKAIDAAVYGLYGLTDEEIKAVEGSA